ncbi:hypothetical protein [Aquimarina aggregata]|uniref:hypothetical protein n=1 Tax=Aquimarina aggregata TaxID=1642818 RepID=UPI002490A65E|nr:hypothetical protein [Aquimarina aggregata]
MESERTVALRINPVDQFSAGASWRVDRIPWIRKIPPNGGIEVGLKRQSSNFLVEDMELILNKFANRKRL